VVDGGTVNDELKAKVEQASAKYQTDKPDFCGVDMTAHEAFTAGAQALYSLLTQSQGADCQAKLAALEAEVKKLRFVLRNTVETETGLIAQHKEERAENERLALELIKLSTEHPCYKLSKELEAEVTRLKSQDLTHAVIAADVKLREENERLREALLRLQVRIVENKTPHTDDIEAARAIIRKALGQGGEGGE